LQNFDRYNPSKTAADVERTLAQYAGKEDVLFAALVKKYGPEPSDQAAAPPADAHERLARFYALYNPDKTAADVDETLARFAGKEDVLFDALVRKYGPEPGREPGAGGAAAAEVPAEEASRRASRRKLRGSISHVIRSNMKKNEHLTSFVGHASRLSRRKKRPEERDPFDDGHDDNGGGHDDNGGGGGGGGGGGHHLSLAAAAKLKKKAHHKHHHRKHLTDQEKADRAKRAHERRSRARASRRNSARAALTDAFSLLDENGDGSLDFEEFAHACRTDPDDPEVRRLFDLLDEDGGGSLELQEIAHALRTRPEAKELAKHFDALHKLVAIAGVRKRRRSSLARRNSARGKGQTPAATAAPPADAHERLTRFYAQPVMILQMTFLD